jgi:hypothetical protein
MPDDLDVRESVGRDLDKARAKIEITHDALEVLLDSHDSDELHRLVARLGRLAIDVRRVEEAVSENVPVG